MQRLIKRQIYILMLHEHNWSNSRIRQCEPLLHKHDETFWSTAFRPSRVLEAYVQLVDTWLTTIVERRIIVHSRVIRWGGIRCGFLHLYAPNHKSARAVFCSHVAHALPGADERCVRGDLNMIETPCYRRGGSKIISMALSWLGGNDYA